MADRNIPFNMTSSVDVGAVAGQGVSVVEYGNGIQHKSTFTFQDAAIAFTDEAGVVAWLGQKFYDFPAGFIVIDGAVANLALTKSSAGVNDTWDGDFGVGTVIASNNATLSSTEQNVIPTTATPQAVAGATTAQGASTAAAQYDGHTTPVDLFLNVLVDDADHNVTGAACNLIVNGTINVFWRNLGDF